MQTLVECICGKKYEVDSDAIKDFECEGCGRSLTVPNAAVAEQVKQLKAQIRSGPYGVREAVKIAVALKSPHVLPVLSLAAESGVRDAVSKVIVGLIAFPGPGHDMLIDWLKSNRLSVSRLASALRDEGSEHGPAFVCALIDKGYIKESQIGEIAPYLGDSEEVKAVKTLKSARLSYPHLSAILDMQLSKLQHLDDSASDIPESAKKIPGQVESPEVEKKGCMGMLLVIGVFFGGFVGVLAKLV
ncbi:MAG: hypothetical protein L3J82_01515 [Planctomycetes bacterium]|nr:hypothetical protein [Planctomycetota bacterium]